MPLLTTQSARGYGWSSLTAAAGDSSFESISTVTLSASTSSLTISSIPSTFQHLQLRCDVRATAGASGGNYANLRLNGDTGTNYTYSYIESHPTTANSVATSSTGNQDRLYGSYISNDGGNTSGYFTSMFIDIWDYANTNKPKTWQCYGGWTDRSMGRNSKMAGHWLNSGSAVSSIFLEPQGASWAAGSTFALYGIKNT